MEAAGWIVHVDDTNNSVPTCGDPFWGHKKGHAVGFVHAVFKGYGNATLNFGNCNKKGTVMAYLNRVKIGYANPMEKTITGIQFRYKPGDVLTLDEKLGIIKIFELSLSCKGNYKIFIFASAI